MTSRTDVRPAAGPGPLRVLFPLLGLPALVLVMSTLEAPTLVAVVLGGLALVAMLLRPRWATVAVVFLLYINAPAVAVSHGTPKAIAGALILLLGIPLAQRVLVRRERLRSDRVFGLMLLFLVVMLLSALGAPGKAEALDRVVVFATEGVLLYWLIINTVTTPETLRRVLWSLLAAGVFLGSLSVYQAATGSYDQQFGGFAERTLTFEHKRAQDIAAGRVEDRMYRADRAEGPQIGANRYAQVMLMLAPLALLMARLAATGRRKWFALAVAGVILAAISLSYSRGGVVGFVIVSWAAVYVGWFRRRHVIAGIVLAALALSVVSPSVFKRVASLGQVTDLEDPTTDGSIRGRATEMLAAAFVFADHPVLGVGPGQYAPYYSAEYQQLPGIGFRDLDKSRRAHSLYLEMAAETGLLGLLLFLAIPFLLLRSLWRVRHRLRYRDPQLSETAAALWLSLLGFLSTAVLLSHAFERYYWLLVAVSGATLHIVATHSYTSRSQAEGAPGLDPVPLGQVYSEHSVTPSEWERS